MKPAFSLVLLIAATLLLPPQPRSAAQASPSTSVFGVNSHIASRYPEWETVERPADLLRELGLGWAREDVQWARVEQEPGAFDWSWYDRVFAAHRRNGVNIIGVITPAVGWATPEAGDAPDAASFFAPDPALYAAFARAAAERYRGQVQAWEIWNEPDDPAFWRPAPDPAAYARLLVAASAAIRGVDPDVAILNGGVVPFDTGFLESLAANGAWGAFDALSVHPYVDPAAPEAAQIDAIGVANVRTLAARLGPKPVWVTEYGWGSGPCERDPAGRTDENAQASYLARGAALMRAAGAERILWYNLKDQALPCYGIVRGGDSADYSSLKPAAAALATLSRQLGGAQPRGPLQLVPSATVLGFDDAGGWGGTVPAGRAPIVSSTEQVHGGAAAGKISYSFVSEENEYIAFLRSAPTPLPAGSTRLGLWVWGDGSGHMLQAQLEDAEGEVLQYRLGFVGTPGWQHMTASLSGEVMPGNRITGGDGRLTEPVRLRALVLDDYPNPAAGSGTIWVDDMEASTGAEVYAQRFDAGGEVVDVLWSLTGGQVRLPSASAEATATDRDGVARAVAAVDGALTLDVGPAPIYVRHIPAAPAPPPPAGPPGEAQGDPAFEQVWRSTDQAVRDGETARSWLWGPAPLKTATEPYAQAPGGSRLVQYYDKARMEINDPDGDRASLFFVTNGLLPIELMTGRLKTGDQREQFEQREPADVPVAGDPAPDNPAAPTYRTLGLVATVDLDEALRRAEPAVGRAVTATLASDGQVGDDAALGRYGVAVTSYSSELGHNVAGAFARYLDALPLPPLFVMGLPISEPYWTRVRVSGVERDVLVQAWERRVLTYTPDNAEAFRIEMGNVGQHYLRWRYGE